MKTVQDDAGKRYLLLKRSDSASLVRDPTTGNECYIRNDRLESVEDESSLQTAAKSVGDSVRTLLTNVHDEETLGLLIELADRGPLSVRTLLDVNDCCESDLHGRLTVLTTAGLLEETEVTGERGYRVTETCEAALVVIRTDATTEPEGSLEPSATGS